MSHNVIPGTVLTIVSLSVSPPQSILSASDIAKKATPAVVVIKCRSSRDESLGTGFIISTDGKIATALHIIRDADSCGVRMSNGETFATVSVLGFDDRRDLAIIKVPGFDLPVLDLGNSNDVAQGDSAVLIGSPQGLQNSVTAGIVSAVRDLPQGIKVIQTDAAANPGNSGGPLLNGRAQVIGVLDFKLGGAENLNFALPINYVRGMLSDLQSAMSLEDMRAKLAKGTDVFRSSAYPARWKSLTSGTSSVLRFDGDRIYAEQVLSEEQRNTNGFVTTEVLKKDGKYIGTARLGFTCQYYRDWYMKWEANRCTFSYPIQLTAVTPTRIEGQVFAPPNGAKFDCKKCSYSKKQEWQSFILIPE